MKNSLSYEAYLKSPYKSIKHSTYFGVYDELFSRYRNKDVTFVEIGVLAGGSLFMWREFLGPKARIIGIDLNPNAKKWEEHGFEIFIGSQSDENFWKDFIGKVGDIDVLLDDGGHKKYSFISYVKDMIDKINYRFAKLKDRKFDKRVWSIQCFESIIAFHINRKASNLISEPTNNNGLNDAAKDYRYKDPALSGRLSNALLRFKILRNILLIWTSKNKSLKKYFTE